jgi:hypothetical protein
VSLTSFADARYDSELLLQGTHDDVDIILL